ncbi:hypothetical protein ACJJID_18130 [Microbulbifer sp. CnH-101-G]|uniref:hypothetical protein n=1 Tax=Microbulbifer sp. CnH-101-G TaxID=3243393 RepID=UPI00403A0A2D
MRAKLQELVNDKPIEQSPHYLLSQELEFEFLKSILTFAMAFIGGIVTLKTALGIDKPINEGLTYSLATVVLSAVFAFHAQQELISDLRKGRTASKIKRLFRHFPGFFLLGISISYAFSYFESSLH